MDKDIKKSVVGQESQIKPRRPVFLAGKAKDKGDKPETTFQTPDEVAANDDLNAAVQLAEKPSNMASEQTSQNKWQRFWSKHWPFAKKEWIVVACLVLVLGGAITAWALARSKPVVIAKPKITAPKPVAPTTVPSTLTGLPVAPSVNQGPVTGVMIENSPDARPQSGLGQAGVVFEAVAEGGVTRFLALFQDTAPTDIGPIRSARPYYIAWDLGFDAPYAHVGGSPDGLNDINAWGVKDLNEFYNAGAYHRISSRLAPHNVYTGVPTLNQLESQKGYNTSHYTGFVRKPSAPSKQPTVTKIGFALSGPAYDPSYVYNTTTNSYDRTMAGAPMVDANTNLLISPKVVIAIVVPETQGALDASGAYYSNYNVIGSGVASVFQDGQLTTGTWTKPDNTTQITFTDSSGKPLGLDPGTTWITAVTTTSHINSAP